MSRFPLTHSQILCIRTHTAASLTPPLCAQRAQVLLELDRPWDAVQAATAACQCAPQWDAVHLTLSRAQLNLGEPRLALGSADAALHCLLQSGETSASECVRDLKEEIDEIESILLRHASNTQQLSLDGADVLQRAALHGSSGSG